MTINRDIDEILERIDQDPEQLRATGAFWERIHQHVGSGHLEEVLREFARYEDQVQRNSVRVALQFVEERDADDPEPPDAA